MYGLENQSLNQSGSPGLIPILRSRLRRSVAVCDMFSPVDGLSPVMPANFLSSSNVILVFTQVPLFTSVKLT